jgi:aromatic ring-opening dioxygenase catalytic subunit (LigB family)
LQIQLGRNALANNIKGVVFIGAHWEELDDSIRVATKPNPNKAQMEMVDPKYWKDYPVNVSIDIAEQVISLLQEFRFKDVKADPTFDWHDDTIASARWMFPEGTPPATVISLNARLNPAFHVRIGRALGELRKEGIMIVGTQLIIYIATIGSPCWPKGTISNPVDFLPTGLLILKGLFLTSFHQM